MDAATIPLEESIRLQALHSLHIRNLSYALGMQIASHR